MSVKQRFLVLRQHRRLVEADVALQGNSLAGISSPTPPEYEAE
jgi:hypothetical protein